MLQKCAPKIELTCGSHLDLGFKFVAKIIISVTSKNDKEKTKFG